MRLLLLAMLWPLLVACGLFKPDLVQMQVTVHADQPVDDIYVKITDHWRGTDNITGLSNGNYEVEKLVSANVPTTFPVYKSSARISVPRIVVMHPMYINTFSHIQLEVNGETVVPRVEASDCVKSTRLSVVIRCIKFETVPTPLTKGGLLKLDVYLVNLAPFLEQYRASLTPEKIKQIITENESEASYQRQSERERIESIMGGMTRMNHWGDYVRAVVAKDLMTSELFVDRYVDYLGDLKSKYAACPYNGRLQEDGSCSLFSPAGRREWLKTAVHNEICYGQKNAPVCKEIPR